MAAGFLGVVDLAQYLHAALDVCDSGAVTALHCLLTISKEFPARMRETTDFEACKQDRAYKQNVYWLSLAIL